MFRSSADIVAGLLRRGDWRQAKCGSDLSRVHWIDAVVQYTRALIADSLESEDFRPSKEHEVDAAAECQEKWQMRGDAVRLMADRVNMFLDEHPTFRRADCDASLLSLRRPGEVAGEYASRIRRLEDNVRARRQVDLTDLSITESRTAIGCKWPCNDGTPGPS